MPFAALVLSILVGAMALLLVLNTASAANELDRHGLAVQDAAAADSVQQLRNEVAASSAPANLARAALAQGMLPATNPAFLMISADGTVTVRGSASPVAAPVAIPPAKHVKKPTKKKIKATKKKAKPTTTSPTTKPKTQPTKPKTQPTKPKIQQKQPKPKPKKSGHSSGGGHP